MYNKVDKGFNSLLFIYKKWTACIQQCKSKLVSLLISIHVKLHYYVIHNVFVLHTLHFTLEGNVVVVCFGFVEVLAEKKSLNYCSTFLFYEAVWGFKRWMMRWWRWVKWRSIRCFFLWQDGGNCEWFLNEAVWWSLHFALRKSKSYILRISLWGVWVQY